MPFYNEIAHTPLFIWDPRCGKKGERRSALVQTIDLAPTLLEYFGLDIPRDMMGHVLRKTIEDDTKVRDFALFGMHGCHVNVTDGHYVYMRATEGGIERNNDNLFNYTLMPAYMKESFSVEELREASLAPAFSFTKGAPLLKVRGTEKIPTMGFPAKTLYDGGHMLFDVEKDPRPAAPHPRRRRGRGAHDPRHGGPDEGERLPARAVPPSGPGKIPVNRKPRAAPTARGSFVGQPARG